MKGSILKILMSKNVVESINDNLDLLLDIIPELKSMIGFEHKHPHHHLDVWNHTLLALSISPQDFIIRITLLLHDIGKPHSYQDEDVRHFKGHANVSSEISFRILKRLNFSDKEMYEILFLIEEHDTKVTEEDINKNRDLNIKRFKIQCCDALAHHPDKLEKRIAYLLSINEKLNCEEGKKYKSQINRAYMKIKSMK